MRIVRRGWRGNSGREVSWESLRTSNMKGWSDFADFGFRLNGL
jgi:hypothetical protein